LWSSLHSSEPPAFTPPLCLQIYNEASVGAACCRVEQLGTWRVALEGCCLSGQPQCLHLIACSLQQRQAASRAPTSHGTLFCFSKYSSPPPLNQLCSLHASPSANHPHTSNAMQYTTCFR